MILVFLRSVFVLVRVWFLFIEIHFCFDLDLCVIEISVCFGFGMSSICIEKFISVWVGVWFRLLFCWDKFLFWSWVFFNNSPSSWQFLKTVTKVLGVTTNRQIQYFGNYRGAKKKNHCWNLLVQKFELAFINIIPRYEQAPSCE